MEAASYGSLMHWTVAGCVIVVSFILKFWGKGLVSSAALLIGLIAGYVLAWVFGMVNFGGVAKAGIIAVPNFMPYGFEFSLGAVIAVTLICIDRKSVV